MPAPKTCTCKQASATLEPDTEEEGMWVITARNCRLTHSNSDPGFDDLSCVECGGHVESFDPDMCRCYDEAGERLRVQAKRKAKR